ncbi:unnamed protein product [Ectocarpus fasciculatus]
MAVVFPQYHRVPENDKFWGEGFTEWTYLRPMDRVVNDIIIRKPHEDIGYYDLTDYEHRRYMRVMADHFGIHGFNFYHFWFKDHPVMYKPTELMLQDGEPNKPFFFTWANEPWSKRWDGSKDNILIAQDYGDEADNTKHFNYLLQFFKHKNYMRVGGKPIFVFYRIDREDVEAISYVMQLWRRLARLAGLAGIHFMRFFGPFDNSVRVPGLEGFIQFEPCLSWVPKGGGPSIFPDGFKVYDKKKTWRVIEERQFSGYSNVVRGTFVNWNNSPRRNYTNGNYENYPHMVDPASVSGFQKHLQSLLKTVNDEATLGGMKLVQLTAWNEWNEQSVFEPNDIDGYDALQAIKNVARRPTNQTVVHVSHRGGGTEKYIQDLMFLFGHYDHIYPEVENNTVFYSPPSPNCALLHIHSVMVGVGALKWDILTYARRFRTAGIPVMVTIHDYQYLFPNTANPTLEFLTDNTPREFDVENTYSLFSMCRTLIFPSQFIRDYYISHLSNRHQGDLLDRIVHSSTVTPNCDMIPNHDFLYLPDPGGKVINVAYTGVFTAFKGADLFLKISEAVKSYVDQGTRTEYQVKYHVFGDIHSSYVQTNYPEITFYGSFKGDKLLKSALKRAKVHILLLPNLSPETYCYALTAGINTGLAVVYLNRGSFIDRLDAEKYDKYFPANTPADMTAALRKGLQFVAANIGEDKTRCCVRTMQIQPTKWYIDNYPTSSKV